MRKDELQPTIRYYTLDFEAVIQFSNIVPAIVDLPAGEWLVFSRLPFRLEGTNFNVPHSRCIRFRLDSSRRLLLYSAAVGVWTTREWVTFVGCDSDKENFGDPFRFTAFTLTGGPITWGAAITAIDINYPVPTNAIIRNMIVDEIALWRLDANSRLTGEFIGRITEVEPGDVVPTAFMDFGNPTAIARGDYDACGFHWQAGSQEQAIIMPTTGQLTVSGDTAGDTESYLWYMIKGRII